MPSKYAAQLLSQSQDGITAQASCLLLPLFLFLHPSPAWDSQVHLTRRGRGKPQERIKGTEAETTEDRITAQFSYLLVPLLLALKSSSLSRIDCAMCLRAPILSSAYTSVFPPGEERCCCSLAMKYPTHHQSLMCWKTWSPAGVFNHREVNGACGF